MFGSSEKEILGVDYIHFAFPSPLSTFDKHSANTMSTMDSEDKLPSSDVRIATASDGSSDHSKKDDNGIVLFPQPTDNPEDPLVCETIVDTRIPYLTKHPSNYHTELAHSQEDPYLRLYLPGRFRGSDVPQFEPAHLRLPSPRIS
jgi:hypothetical protein